MRAALSHRPEVKVCLMPNDQYAASTLNLGVQACGGDYVFRFDDDVRNAPLPVVGDAAEIRLVADLEVEVVECIELHHEFSDDRFVHSLKTAILGAVVDGVARNAPHAVHVVGGVHGA